MFKVEEVAPEAPLEIRLLMSLPEGERRNISRCG